MRRTLQVEVHQRQITPGHCLDQGGPNGRKPTMTPNHKEARPKLTLMHTDKPQNFWENVFWTVETKLELLVK